MLAASIDVYVTYRCNLRCSHCFIGKNLESNRNFDPDLLRSLISQCVNWGTTQITFLGGEPTLYPGITEVVKSVQTAGIKARLITNGLHGFRRFMTSFDGTETPIVGFSIDGSTADVHEEVRGPHTFVNMLINIERSKKLGYSSYAIISISRQNLHDLPGILKLCNDIGFMYVNIHYVVNRGYAQKDMVLSIDEWERACQMTQLYTRSLDIEVRIESTFAPQGSKPSLCAVREESNLMFYPDGRVFMCPLFIDSRDAHSYIWTRDGLIPNSSPLAERSICEHRIPTHCPAFPHMNAEVASEALVRGLQIRCVLDKSWLRRGVTVNDSDMSQGD